VTTEPSQTARVGAARPGSGLVARLLTAVYALLITPIASALLSYGGTSWLRYRATTGSEASFGGLLASPVGAAVLLGMGLGLLLLVSVVATGIVSSAGLVLVGAMGLASVILSAVPALLMQVYRLTGDILPFEVLDGLVHGLPLILHPLMGGLGLALVIARRRPRAPLVAAIAGLVLLPLMLLAGTGMALGGLGAGTAWAMRTFDTQVAPLALVLVLAGALLVWLSAAASGISPYALVVPALLLLLASAAALSPTMPGLTSLWTSHYGSGVVTFLIVGGGVASATVMLAHTAVLALVRGRAGRRLRTAESGAAAS